MTSKKFTASVLAVGALILVCCLILALTQRRSATRQRLPDGSYLQLCKVECGIAHPYGYARAIPRWNSWVYGHLPVKLALVLDCEPFGAASLTMASSWVTNGSGYHKTLGFATNLGVFAIFEGRTNSPYSILRLSVSDDSGNSWDAGFPRGSSSTLAGAFHCELDGWLAPAPPSEAKQLRLRFYEAFKKDSPPVAEFLVSNPVPNAGMVGTTYSVLNGHTNLIDVHTN